MSSTGVIPTEEGEVISRSVARRLMATASKERLAEFDRLMAEGGIDAVVEALKREKAAA